MRLGYIYKITNLINGKIYIGRTVQNVQRRWRQHVTMDYNKKYYLGKAIHKYGEQNFKVEIIEECDEIDLDNKEIAYIAQYDSTDPTKGYNVSLGGWTPKKKLPDVDIDFIKDLYLNQHLSLHAIAEIVGIVKWHRIETLLISNGVTIRDRHDFGMKYKVSKEDLSKALKEHKSLRKAAKSLGISYSAFRKQCLRNNIEYNSSKSTRQL